VGKCVMNCKTCGYRNSQNQNQIENGYCYMWKEEPEGKCFQHTSYKTNIEDSLSALISVIVLLQREGK